YVIPILSDPFGWGWNLFGTAHAQWTPMLPHWVPYMQAILLLAGLFYSIVSIFKIARTMYEKKEEAIKSIIPIVLLLLILTLTLFKIYMG
ncbi:MAG: hypothetical protein ACUZ8I_17820, partial [Candidatus Scalindua sp.]